ncbi:MAG: EutN/CcmL family microcompartment protein [Gaiellales bacterium]
MLLARVIGRVVSESKLEELRGKRFSVIEVVDGARRGTGRHYVAVDTVGAGEGRLVLTASAGAARLAAGCADLPVDLAVVGIVDEIGGERT